MPVLNTLLRSIIVVCLFCFSLSADLTAQPIRSGESYAMVIHGGAGTILKENFSAEKEKAYKEALTAALQAGYDQIKAGKSALDAVEAAIQYMEDCPLFNSGKGAVFTHEGRNELDASIMDGRNLNAGAVAGITIVKNPIKAARAVMEKSKHVMLSGAGAEQFAKDVNLEIVDPSYFYTERRWESLQKARKRDSIEAAGSNKTSTLGTTQHLSDKFGTVGAVALDRQGHLAAGTSTGGMNNKKHGRIGDSPIIGAGTYANDQTVAVSCTGWGEFFIRTGTARTVSVLMKYARKNIAQAAQGAIQQVADLGGTGGLIALDKDGNAAFEFNTRGMYRGTVTKDGKIEVALYP